MKNEIVKLEDTVKNCKDFNCEHFYSYNYGTGKHFYCGLKSVSSRKSNYIITKENNKYLNKEEKTEIFTIPQQCPFYLEHMLKESPNHELKEKDRISKLSNNDLLTETIESAGRDSYDGCFTMNLLISELRLRLSSWLE